VPAANRFLLGSYVSPMLSPQTQTGDSVEPRELHHSISSPGALLMFKPSYFLVDLKTQMDSC
jgi:hypothetical protein